MPNQTHRTVEEAADKAEKKVVELREGAQEIKEQVKERAVRAFDGLRRQAKNHPIAALTSALGVGLVAGFLLRRR